MDSHMTAAAKRNHAQPVIWTIRGVVIINRRLLAIDTRVGGGRLHQAAHLLLLHGRTGPQNLALIFGEARVADLVVTHLGAHRFCAGRDKLGNGDIERLRNFAHEIKRRTAVTALDKGDLGLVDVNHPRQLALGDAARLA